MLKVISQYIPQAETEKQLADKEMREEKLKVKLEKYKSELLNDQSIVNEYFEALHGELKAYQEKRRQQDDTLMSQLKEEELLSRKRYEDTMAQLEKDKEEITRKREERKEMMKKRTEMATQCNLGDGITAQEESKNKLHINPDYEEDALTKWKRKRRQKSLEGKKTDASLILTVMNENRETFQTPNPIPRITPFYRHFGPDTYSEFLKISGKTGSTPEDNESHEFGRGDVIKPEQMEKFPDRDEQTYPTKESHQFGYMDVTKPEKLEKFLDPNEEQYYPVNESHAFGYIDKTEPGILEKLPHSDEKKYPVKEKEPFGKATGGYTPRHYEKSKLIPSVQGGYTPRLPPTQNPQAAIKVFEESSLIFEIPEDGDSKTDCSKLEKGKCEPEPEVGREYGDKGTDIADRTCQDNPANTADSERKTLFRIKTPDKLESGQPNSDNKMNNTVSMAEKKGPKQYPPSIHNDLTSHDTKSGENRVSLQRISTFPEPPKMPTHRLQLPALPMSKSEPHHTKSTIGVRNKRFQMKRQVPIDDKTVTMTTTAASYPPQEPKLQQTRRHSYTSPVSMYSTEKFFSAYSMPFISVLENSHPHRKLMRDTEQTRSLPVDIQRRRPTLAQTINHNKSKSLPSPMKSGFSLPSLHNIDSKMKDSKPLVDEAPMKLGVSLPSLHSIDMEMKADKPLVDEKPMKSGVSMPSLYGSPAEMKGEKPLGVEKPMKTGVSMPVLHSSDTKMKDAKPLADEKPMTSNISLPPLNSRDAKLKDEQPLAAEKPMKSGVSLTSFYSSNTMKEDTSLADNTSQGKCRSKPDTKTLAMVRNIRQEEKTPQPDLDIWQKHKQGVIEDKAESMTTMHEQIPKTSQTENTNVTAPMINYATNIPQTKARQTQCQTTLIQTPAQTDTRVTKIPHTQAQTTHHTDLLTTSQSHPIMSQLLKTTNQSNVVMSQLLATKSQSHPIMSQFPMTSSQSNPIVSKMPMTTNQSNPIISQLPMTTSKSHPITSQLPMTTSQPHPIMSQLVVTKTYPDISQSKPILTDIVKPYTMSDFRDPQSKERQKISISSRKYMQDRDEQDVGKEIREKENFDKKDTIPTDDTKHVKSLELPNKQTTTIYQSEDKVIGQNTVVETQWMVLKVEERTVPETKQTVAKKPVDKAKARDATMMVRMAARRPTAKFSEESS